jgi:hypothetical protein
MGKLIKDIKEILKNGKIVCWNCKRENLNHTHNYTNSGEKKDGINYRLHELHCKDCDKRFIYSAILNSEEDKMFENIIIEKEE